MKKSILALALAALGAHIVAASAQDTHHSILNELRRTPANAYDVGVLKIERIVSGLDNELWSYTYDLSDYGDDVDSYMFKSDNVNYRYGYVHYARESDQLFLIGVALAEGNYMKNEICVLVLEKFVDELLSLTGSGGSKRGRAGRFLEQVFPYSEPWTDDSEEHITELLLDAVLVEVRLFESLPQAAPDLSCQGHLYDDRDGFKVSAFVE